MNTTTNNLREGDNMEQEQVVNVSPFTQHWEILGYKKNGEPIWPIRGGAEDDDEGEDDANDDGDEGEEGDDESDNSSDDGDEGDEGDDAPEKKFKKPPVKKPAPPVKPEGSGAESKLELTLRREREGRKAAERQLRALRQKNESDAERLEREAEERASAKYKPVAVRSAARAALKDAGITGDPALAIKLLDMDLIDVDDDGDVTGVNEQVSALKEEYPQLFVSESRPGPGNGRKAKPAGKINPGNRKPVDGEQKKTSAQILAERFEQGAMADA